MNIREVKIGVLGGGVSGERDISLISARESHKALQRKALNSAFIDIYTSREETVKKLIQSEGVELAFIALHGEFGEDGIIQQILEDMGIPYTGSGPRASALAMNKILSKKVFIEAGIPVPHYDICYDVEKIPENISYPVVIKPHFCGSSLGLSVVKGKSALRKAVAEAFLHQNKVIMEEFIEGRELTVGILGDKALEVVEIVSKKGYFDFDTKYNEGQAEFKAPAQLDRDVYAKVQQTALEAYQALDCRNFCRVDIRLGRDSVPYVLEVNSIPGLTPRSLLPLSAKAHGIDFDDLILKMVEMVIYEKEKIQKVQKGQFQA